MNRREARQGMTELKKEIRTRFPDMVLKEGPGFEGGPRDIYLYAYAEDEKTDAILEMASPRVSDILLKTGVLVHVITLRPGTMTWLWDNGKKAKKRRSTRAVAPHRAARSNARVLAESRATYKTGKAAVRRKAVHKRRQVNGD